VHAVRVKTGDLRVLLLVAEFSPDECLDFCHN
jgi:hypothetical protein